MLAQFSILTARGDVLWGIPPSVANHARRRIGAVERTSGPIQARYTTLCGETRLGPFRGYILKKSCILWKRKRT
jgi:hypothetical protein